MLQPDVVEVFVAEYVAESDRLPRDRDAAAHRQELRGVGAAFSGWRRFTVKR